MHVYDTADVWTHGIDSSMRAKACWIDPQVGGALLDHIPDDVHFHLRREAQCQRFLLDLFIMLLLFVITNDCLNLLDVK